MTNDERLKTKAFGVSSVLRPSSFVLLIILLAFMLRLAFIADLRMWGDEGYSVYSSARSLDAITFVGAENDPHPPLYYYLLHFYMPLAGASELALRFFSAFFGTLTVALAFIIGKRVFNFQVGTVAAAFGAIAPFAIYYSQEIRMYALTMFFTALAIYCFVRWQYAIRNMQYAPRVTYHIICYALSMLAALYSLYHTAFVFLAMGIFLLPLFFKQRTFFFQWLIVSILTIVAFFPMLYIRFSSTLGHLEDRAGHTIQPLPMFIARGFAALTVGTTIPVNNALWLAGIFLAIIILGLFIAWRAHILNCNDWLIFSLTLVPLVAVYPMYLLLPILVGRLFALAFVPLAILLARSIIVIVQNKRWTVAPIALLVVGISGYSLSDYYFNFSRYNAAAENYVPAIQWIQDHAQPGDEVLINAYWQQGYFLSHYRGAPITYGAINYRVDMVESINQPRSVWTVVYNQSTQGAENWLGQNAFFVDTQNFGRMRVSWYRASTLSHAEKFAAPITFDNGMQLIGYKINAEPLPAGRGVVTIQFDWTTARAIADDYTISVRVVDASGTVFAQDDRQPSDGENPTSTWTANQIVQDKHAAAISPNTVPGSYAIQIVVYRSASGDVAKIIAPENSRGTSFTFGQVEVVSGNR